MYMKYNVKINHESTVIYIYIISNLFTFVMKNVYIFDESVVNYFEITSKWHTLFILKWIELVWIFIRTSELWNDNQIKANVYFGMDSGFIIFVTRNLFSAYLLNTEGHERLTDHNVFNEYSECNAISLLFHRYISYCHASWLIGGWNIMMTSSNGNIFRVTGHLCGEFTGYRWIPHIKASDAELLMFSLICLNERLSKQS